MPLTHLDIFKKKMDLSSHCRAGWKMLQRQMRHKQLRLERFHTTFSFSQQLITTTGWKRWSSFARKMFKRREGRETAHSIPTSFRMALEERQHFFGKSHEENTEAKLKQWKKGMDDTRTALEHRRMIEWWEEVGRFVQKVPEDSLWYNT